jgi:hypothetical protein
VEAAFSWMPDPDGPADILLGQYAAPIGNDQTPGESSSIEHDELLASAALTPSESLLVEPPMREFPCLTSPPDEDQETIRSPWSA